jgi:probable phosphoglycerate mutase
VTAAAAARLVLARHAESEGNAARVWQGQSGLGLTCRGRAQAAALADRLAAEDGVVAVVCSDQRRVAETAAPLRDRTGWPVAADPRWRELDVGAWTGRPVAEVRRSEPDRFAAFREGRGPAGGDGEAFSDLRARVAVAIAELARALGDGGTALVLTHGWTLRAAVAELTGREPGAERELAGVGNASVCLIERASDWRVIAYDDRTHLPVELRARPDEHAA